MRRFKLNLVNRAILELLQEKIKTILRSGIVHKEDVDSIHNEALQFYLEDKERSQDLSS